jgi:lipopolysaccharide/colanic/teichoic acid biosynthesis glycosyltransferase
MASDRKILPHRSDAEVGGATAPLSPQDNPHWLPEPTRLYRVAKRILDIVGSLVALVLLAPLFVAIAAAIRLTSRGPVFFRDARLGYRAKPFLHFKFRTMYTDADPQIHVEYVRRLISRESQAQAGQPVGYEIDEDPRVTWVGLFLRRTSLDQLPELLNVLRGDMSLVGPRPSIPFEWEAYADWHELRLSRKPGMTGLWQVRGRNRATFDDMVLLDLEYAKHPSILLDLRLLIGTPGAILRDKGAY